MEWNTAWHEYDFGTEKAKGYVEAIKCSNEIDSKDTDLLPPYMGYRQICTLRSYSMACIKKTPTL